jgi:hypothetical protein
MITENYSICESCCEHYKEIPDSNGNRKEITECCFCQTVRYQIKKQEEINE